MAANKQDPRYFKYSPFPKRQCAVTGAVDANGAASFMSMSLNTVGFSASAFVPLVVTWANGFNPFPVDYAYKWTSAVSGPSGWTGFASGTHYLYIDYDPDTDTVSYGSTTVVPNDDLAAPSHGSGVHWFDQSQYKMYESVASVWTERIRVFIGECVSNGTVVSSVISYALNGRYNSPETSVGAAGVATILSHNIGTNKLDGACRLICKTAEGNYSIGDITSNFIEESASAIDFAGIAVTFTRLNITKTSGGYASGTYIMNKTNGLDIALTDASWRYLISAERNY